jgi:glycyl-tRNA synthetase
MAETLDPTNGAPAATTLQDIVSHAKEYGFVFPSSEIYDGLAAVYDYGPVGVELKNNLKRLWWQAMTQLHQNIVGIDAAIFMHPLTWKASGHVDSFSDPLIDNKDSKKRYRADVLLEDRAQELERAGENQRAADLLAEMGRLLTDANFDGVRQLIIDEKIVCPISKTANWTEVRQFNLMYSTQMSATSGEGDTALYLRPETAQGIFVNFLNVQKSARMKIPFGIAQIGKAFRNEIVARQFIFRMREFEQMEMQYFIRPGTEMEWYAYWKETRKKWHEALGTPTAKLRYHDHDKLAHYANAAVDIEFEFPFGFKEIEGIHSRTDFDLTQHQALSKKKQQYFDNDIDPETGKAYGNYVPYVVETSVGADRLFLATLCNAYRTEEEPEGKGLRTWLALHPAVAPVKAAILPLVRKDGLPEVGQQIYDDLKYDFNLIYEDRDSIGKRYTRQDLIGTPFCIAIDHQTLEDQMVTIRHRDARTQERVAISALRGILAEATSPKRVLEKL